MKITRITNDEDYKRVQARLRSMRNVPARDAEEAEELWLLADELERYSYERFEFLRVPTDGVDEVINGLDYNDLTLDDALRAFGGLERFIEYMTRRSKLDDATLDALVTEFGLDRAELEKAHLDRPGWPDLSPEGQEPCDDPECSPPGERNWRLVLSELLTARGARELAGV